MFCLLFAAVSCATAGNAAVQHPPENAPPAPAGGDIAAGQESPGRGGTAEGNAIGTSIAGVAGEIRRLTELGTLSSMRQAMNLIKSRDLGGTEYGRVMNAVNITLIKRIYPADSEDLPAADMPQTHLYARILNDAKQGIYRAPPTVSADFLEHVLPFLALSGEKRPERLLPVLPDLRKARRLRPESVIIPYFTGLLNEQAGKLEDALTAYTLAEEISPECYPAVLGRCGIMWISGREREALNTLKELRAQYPGNITVMRHLAAALYEMEDWAEAEPVISEVLRKESRNGEFLLMKTRILVETRQYMQAQSSLDQYASFSPATRLYLFLRARVQAEAYHNREQALGFLRTLLKSYPGDGEALTYAAGLLIESSEEAERQEGREMIRRMLQDDPLSVSALSLGLQDAVNRESWQEARELLNRLLALRRQGRDIYSAYLVERGLGNNDRALAYARELYERDTTSDIGIFAYISALIDMGRLDEASRRIEQRLASLPGGQAKSRYYYLRSRTAKDEETILADLRSALYEDPRSPNALIAMFEIYHRRKDERRAVYYLKQALAVAPGNPRLRQYQSEYSSSL